MPVTLRTCRLFSATAWLALSGVVIGADTASTPAASDATPGPGAQAAATSASSPSVPAQAPPTATSSTPAQASRSAWAYRNSREQRAYSLVPRRREEPLRSENLTDNEVREIQATVAGLQPGAIVNIGSVVEGCPCEDGSSCSQQVWIVAWRPERSTGFNLSRINEHWVLGPLQSWWFEFASLQASMRKYPHLSDYLDAEQKMLDRMPSCQSTEPAVAPPQAASASAAGN